MNKFKAASVTIRRGYWMDFSTNRENKRRCRRKARHDLNKGCKLIFAKIGQQIPDHKGS